LKPKLIFCVARSLAPVLLSETMRQITASELSAWLADGAQPQPVLLDVREPWEYATCCIPSSILMPLQSLPARYTELARDTEIVVICHHGARSFQAGMFLEQNGFGTVINLQGGVAAWARDVSPTMPTY
jgi:rhodanese-related sulfurtransferase